LIEQEFATFPIKALAARETRGVFKDWRDKLSLKSVRQADYAWTVLARIFSVAKDRDRITVNPCERGGRLYNATRVDSVRSIEDEAAFLQQAPAHLHLALLLALWTGQRQGDLLRLTLVGIRREAHQFAPIEEHTPRRAARCAREGAYWCAP